MTVAVTFEVSAEVGTAVWAGLRLKTLILNSDVEYLELEDGDPNQPLWPVVSGRTVGPAAGAAPATAWAHVSPLPRF